MRQELLNLHGVVAADVSYDEKLATVSYLAEQVTLEQMVEAINATGFSASLLEPDADNE